MIFVHFKIGLLSGFEMFDLLMTEVFQMSMVTEKATKGASAKEARDRARLNRVRLDQAREERDQAIETAAADFFQFAAEAEALRAALTDNEARMSGAVARLRSLGEKDGWIAELLEVEPREVTRLGKLAPSRDSGATQQD